MSTPDTGTDHPRRNWRQWRIPAKIYGRVRTSTVALGICFVLTGLLYGQVNDEINEINEQNVQGPKAVDSGELTPYTQQQSSQRSYTSTTTPTPSTTTDSEQSGSVDGTGQSSTTVPTTTTAPFGVPIPPAIQSLIPTRPSPTTAR